MKLISATVQFKPKHGKPEENRQDILSLCKKAVEGGARLISFPEMCLTGYVWLDPHKLYALTEKANGESFRLLAEFCRHHSCFLSYGFAEKAGSHRYYNSQNLIGTDGQLLATYRKKHLFQLDTFWAFPGDKFVSVRTSIGKIGLGICMDLNYDDFVEFHVQQQTQWLCFATNWLEEGLDILPYWNSRWGNFQGTVFMSNTYGQERQIPFCGQSCVYHQNQFLMVAPKQESCVLLCSHTFD